MIGQHAEYTRNFYATLVERLGAYAPLIQVISGPRQIGKTTAIKKLISQMSERSTYINLDNPGPNPHERIRFEWNRAIRLNGHKLIVFDEIQNVSGWASLLKELYDEERPKRQTSVAVLGSSALELLLRGEESLLGRFEIIRAPHWSPDETKEAFGWELEQFLQFGGYPILGELFKKILV